MGSICSTSEEPLLPDTIARSNGDERKDGLDVPIKGGFYYPSSEADIQSIIKKANKQGKKVRVLGSGHSAKGTILGKKNEISFRIRLDNLRSIVKWDDANMRITVETGMILFHNPLRDYSTKTNGLCHQINEKGWALPNLGGIAQQSVAGFILNGCAGGSIAHSFLESVYSFRMVDGTGKVRSYTRDAHVVGSEDADDGKVDKGNEYWGAVVSMGLCGVMTQCTFQCIPKFRVVGGETALSCAAWRDSGDISKSGVDNIGRLDLKATDNADPASFYAKVHGALPALEYCRFFWYPQSDEEWVVLWKAHREEHARDSKDAEYVRAGIYDAEGTFQGNKYDLLSQGIKGKLEQEVIKIAYDTMERFVDQDTGRVPRVLQKALDKLIDELAINDQNPQSFGHDWHETLPMDQVISQEKVPAVFTELWVDMEDCCKALNVCWKYFEGDEGLQRKGTFAWEFYCAKADHAWVRPNYGNNCFRIDCLWIDTPVSTRDPYAFYLPLWNFFVENGVRFKVHWGKYVPKGSETFPQLSKKVLQEWGIKKSFVNWNEYYQWMFKEDDCWNKFLGLIKKNDPNGVFMIDYWNDIFFLGNGSK